jgi:glycosyltransferase involved in cell wall biosynthesis
MPAVSVIIPAYRVCEYIAETLDSIAAQTFRDFETIVVNDGCPESDRLERILQPFRGSIVYLRKANGGLSSARNAGINVARAPLIALLDGDDAWFPNYLEVQVPQLVRRPDVDVLYPNGVYFGDRLLDGKELMDVTPSQGPVTFESLVLQRCSVTISVIARRDAVLRVGGFDERLQRVEDFDLWLRMLKAGSRIEYHRTPLLRYRRRPDSLSASGIAMREAALQVLDKVAAECSLSEQELRVLAEGRRRFTAELNYHRAKEALRVRDAEAAAENFKRVLAYRWSAKHAALVTGLKIAPRQTLALAEWLSLRR